MISKSFAVSIENIKQIYDENYRDILRTRDKCIGEPHLYSISRCG
jgi:hypothetical protein